MDPDRIKITTEILRSGGEVGKGKRFLKPDQNLSENNIWLELTCLIQSPISKQHSKQNSANGCGTNIYFLSDVWNFEDCACARSLAVTYVTMRDRRRSLLVLSEPTSAVAQKLQIDVNVSRKIAHGTRSGTLDPRDNIKYMPDLWIAIRKHWRTVYVGFLNDLKSTD